MQTDQAENEHPLSLPLDFSVGMVLQETLPREIISVVRDQRS